MLANLDHLLSKAQEFVESKKCDPSAITLYRLAPDMFTFARQIQIACDGPKNGLARLAGIEAPKFADDEKSLEELRARVQKTLDFIATISSDSLVGSESKDVTFPSGRDTTRTMQGEAYLTQWLLPNLYFHVVTAYNILRHNGVAVGKADYLRGGQK